MLRIQGFGILFVWEICRVSLSSPLQSRLIPTQNSQGTVSEGSCLRFGRPGFSPVPEMGVLRAVDCSGMGMVSGLSHFGGGEEIIFLPRPEKLS